MKKLTIIVVSVIFVLTSVLAGTALAAKPDNTPREAWDMIVEKVEEIVGILFNLGANVTDLKSDVEAVDSKVESLSVAVDDVANMQSQMAKVESDTIELEYIYNGCDNLGHSTFLLAKEYTFEEVRHVRLIFKISDWYEFESFRVYASYFEDDSYRVDDTYHYDYGTYRIVMYEFDAIAFNIFQVLMYHDDCDPDPPPPLLMTYMYLY
ncbi:MAG TPA: hypothetical protein G4O15_11035 [Dehalococcoidia bacterium]|nr:hypothetical protein [Dehalococcoidia bacterium]